MSWWPRQPLGRAVEHDAAVLHDVAVVGDVERDPRVLLDQEDRDPELVADRLQPRGEVLHDERREAERELVDEQQLRPAGERGADREHLPLAAGEQPRLARAQARERRKVLVDRLDEPAPLRRARGARHGGLEVFGDREVLEHLAALGDEHDAERGHAVRRAVLDALALVADRAFGDARVVDPEEARDRAERRRLAGAVRAEQRDDRALRHARAVTPCTAVTTRW